MRAVRALQSADVILFDDLVSREVLDFARREARKMLVGKTGFGPSCKQEDINALDGEPRQTGQARRSPQGRRSADLWPRRRRDRRLRSGQHRGRRGARHYRRTRRAARLGLPLTDRKHARRLQYVTGHARRGKLPADLDWQSLADPTTTTAIYMPVRTLAALVEKATAEGLDPQTPALAIARATRPDQAVVSRAHRRTSQRVCRSRFSRPGARDDRARMGRETFRRPVADVPADQ